MVIILALFMAWNMQAAEDVGNDNLSRYVKKLSGNLCECVDDLRDHARITTEITILHELRQFVDTAAEVEWNVHKQHIPMMVAHINRNRKQVSSRCTALTEHLATLQAIESAPSGIAYTPSFEQLEIALKENEQEVSRSIDGVIEEDLQGLFKALDEVLAFCEGAS